MKNMLWANGRFKWSFISVIVFTTFAVLGFDYYWRNLEMPFVRLVAYAMAFWFMGIVLIKVVARVMETVK